MDTLLTQLIGTLESTIKALKGDSNAALLAALHDHSKLPDKEVYGLAGRAVDLLHEAELLLEPSSLTLADHFLGMYGAHGGRMRILS